jgi:predicted PurR-regulated permease PerM
MRKKIHPMAVLGIVLVALVVCGLFGMKLAAVTTAPPQTVVKIDHPDDPKFKADPKLGVAAGTAVPTQGGGGAN